ncbi:MAG TPA: hypothetical protein ENI23_17905 [bacterium]|nr:hypothetical protein [bacterium]
MRKDCKTCGKKFTAKKVSRRSMYLDRYQQVCKECVKKRKRKFVNKFTFGKATQKTVNTRVDYRASLERQGSDS